MEHQQGLKEQNLKSESNKIMIEATELDAGTYYYVITVGNENVKADKLVIVK